MLKGLALDAQLMDHVKVNVPNAVMPGRATWFVISPCGGNGVVP
jgi:hypothetical protein